MEVANKKIYDRIGPKGLLHVVWCAQPWYAKALDMIFAGTPFIYTSFSYRNTLSQVSTLNELYSVHYNWNYHHNPNILYNLLRPRYIEASRILRTYGIE